MADVFVSYAKTDRSLASKLVAMLEAEGWKVWWDTSLGAADLYRDEIMKQLAAARAVITIWTPSSIKSDWVRAEAGRAKAEGKLIPVKTADVAYADIPLPFGEMHTENVEASQLIRAAVVAQLAKPAVEPTAWALLTKGFKYELLTWVGIVGGALTLFTNLGAVLKLADWARVLVEHWKQWTHAFWVWAFSWLGIHLPPVFVPMLSFIVFWSAITLGQAIQYTRIIKTQVIADKYEGKSFQPGSWRTLLCAVSIIVAESWWTMDIWNMDSIVASYITIPAALENSQWFAMIPIKVSTVRIIIVVLGSIMIFAPAIILLILFARNRSQAAMAILCMGYFTFITQLVDSSLIGEYTQVYAMIANIAMVVMVSILPLILLSVAPAKAVSRHLIFLALGLLLLIGLNELSKFGFDVAAPKLSG